MSKLDKALNKARHDRESTGLSAVLESEKPVQNKLARAYEKASSQQEKKDLLSAFRPVAENTDKDIKLKYHKTRVLPPVEKILEKQRILTHLRKPGFRDSYDYFCTQVLQRTREKGWNSLMVSSAYTGEGKTTTAINLALSIAREVQQTALLVGANFRNPKVCTYFGLDEDRPGLSDYLVNGSQISDLLFSPGIEKMVVLPSGKRVSSDKNFLGSPKMKSLVEELKSRYPDRYVIYDCPHVLDMPDTLVFTSYVDAVLLVVEAGRTPGQDVERAVQTLTDRGVNIVGVLLNKAA